MQIHCMCIFICEIYFYRLLPLLFWDSSNNLLLNYWRNGMTRRKFRQFRPSRFKHRRFLLEDIPLKTMKVTLYALRWIFLLIFIFIILGILVLFLTGGSDYMQIILGYSIAGFFTFFMGYFGWILAQSMIEMITGAEDEATPGLSYYFKRKRGLR